MSDKPRSCTTSACSGRYRVSRRLLKGASAEPRDPAADAQRYGHYRIGEKNCLGWAMASRSRCNDQALHGGVSGVISVRDATASLTHVPEDSRRWQSAPSRQTGVGQQVTVATTSVGHAGCEASGGLTTAAPHGVSAVSKASSELTHVQLGWPGCSQGRRGGPILVSRWLQRSAAKRSTARRAITAAFSGQSTRLRSEHRARSRCCASPAADAER